jgi:hypothetical protein
MTPEQFIDELLYLRYPKLRPEPAVPPASPAGANARHLTLVV